MTSTATILRCRYHIIHMKSRASSFTSQTHAITWTLSRSSILARRLKPLPPPRVSQKASRNKHRPFLLQSRRPSVPFTTKNGHTNKQMYSSIVMPSPPPQQKSSHMPTHRFTGRYICIWVSQQLSPAVLMGFWTFAERSFSRYRTVMLYAVYTATQSEAVLLYSSSIPERAFVMVSVRACYLSP